MRLCCPKCCEGYHEDLVHCPRCGPIYGGRELETLTAERDRLAAELAAANAAHAQLVIDYEQVMADLEESDATLDRLREAVPEGEGRSWSMLDATYAILYPVR